MELNLISKYRTQLMGIAAIMIILCHTVPYGIELPRFLLKPLEYCNIGVEIFLFLSGLGCYYSLSKGIGVKEWYKKRFIRIFVPYVIICFFSLVGDIFGGDIDWLMYLYQFSTLSYWTHHNAAWFVALLIPLYLITPFFYNLIRSSKNSFCLVCFICLIITMICSIPVSAHGLIRDTITNTFWAWSRTPAFFLGLYIAPYVRDGVKLNIVYFLPIFFLFAAVKYFMPQTQVNWIMTLPLTMILCYVIRYLENCSGVYAFMTWLGTASLESYLANVSVNGKMHFLLAAFPNTSIFQGHYLDCALAIVFSLFFTYIGHKLSSKVFSMIR